MSELPQVNGARVVFRGTRISAEQLRDLVWLIMRAWLWCLLAGLLAAFFSPPAQAYTISGLLTKGCHERVTGAALRAVRAENGAGTRAGAAAAPLTRDDRLMIDDLPFTTNDGLHDIGAATLLIGVRENDLKGHSATDAAELSVVHGDPDGQREHCLRRPDQDEGGITPGSESALAECRAYIRQMLAYALAHGLTADGIPDVNRRVPLKVHLVFRGPVRPMLPLFWLYAGQGLHAFQDSFTHAFRSPDHKKVRVVLNWTDYANDSLIEHRDGPPHEQGLDQCSDLDGVRQERFDMAVAASIELLNAVLRADLGPGDRLAAANTVLDSYLSLESGCNAGNRWCDAPERAYADTEGCACRMAGMPKPAGAATFLGIAGWCCCLRRYRRRGWAGSLVGAILAALLAASPLRASERACVPGQQVACACPGAVQGAQICQSDGAAFGPCAPCAVLKDESVAEPIYFMPSGSRFGFYTAVGGALDHTAGLALIAGRYRLNTLWLVGADLEWNPWGSIETRRVRAGAMNAYATIVRRYHMTRHVSARTSLHAGVSTLLFSLFGAPAGSVGPYFGISALGIEVDMGSGWRFVVDPMEVAVPIPHATGVPLIYNQYRFIVGLQFGG